MVSSTANDKKLSDTELFLQAVADIRPLNAKFAHAIEPHSYSRNPGLRELWKKPHTPQAKLNTHHQQLAEKNTAQITHDKRAFLEAMKDVRPLTSRHHQTQPKPTPKVRPVPRQLMLDERQALADSLSDYLPLDELESGEELLYLRPGHSPLVLQRLRRGHWVVQAGIDLHGMVSDEARLYVSEFIAHCKKRNIRCIRIVHGKGLGSKNREPILKNKLRAWLIQKDEVIAYAQARPHDGGSGAVVVLLKS